jgi:hypothetical protein
VKKAQPLGRHENDGATRDVAACHEPTGGRLLPHREARAGSPPRFEGLLVVASLRAEPLEEVQDEYFDGVRHARSHAA